MRVLSACNAAGCVAALGVGSLPALCFPAPSCWWLAWLGLAPLLLVVALAGWLVLGTSVFGVRDVVVSGASILSPDEIRQAAAVRPGTPLARVDLAAVRARVAALAPVATVRVDRDWPDTLTVAVREGKGEMPGGTPATMIMTLGYDPQQKRFVGTWIGSMMTHLWVYDGERDVDERVLTLNSEGPSMSGDGTMSSYQDVIEFKSNDHRTLTARVRAPDGTWQQFMTMDYRRKQ